MPAADTAASQQISGRAFDNGKERQGMVLSVGLHIVVMEVTLVLFTVNDAKIVHSPIRPAEWRNCCRALKHKRVAAFLQAIARVVNSSDISNSCQSVHYGSDSGETRGPPCAGCFSTFNLWKAWVCWVLIVTAIVIALGSCHRTPDSADS